MRRRGAWIAVGLVLLVLFFFREAATLSGALFHFDLIGMNIPIRASFFRMVRQGVLPLWSPEVCGGYPVFQEGQVGPLYFGNLLFLTSLPPWVAMNLTIVLHAVWGMLGAYRWLSTTRSAPAAAIGAISYIFAPHLVFHLVHVMFFQGACWLPWLFFAFDRYRRERRGADLLLMALVLGAILSVGHQQFAVLAFMGFSLYAGLLVIDDLLDRRSGEALRTAFSAFFPILLALCMGSVVLAGLFDLLADSVRHGALDTRQAFIESLTPDLFVRLASPLHHGRFFDNTWWLGVSEKEMTVYPGLAVWLFVPLAFLARMDRRGRAHLAVLAFGFLFMLGRAGPFSEIVPHIPILNQTRVPVRFLFPMTISLAWCVAAGVDAIGDLSPARFRLGVGVGIAGWGALALGGALLTFGEAFLGGRAAPRLVRLLPVLRADLLLRLSLLLLLAAGAWGLRRARERSLRGILWIGLALLSFGDLASLGRGENPVADPAIFGPFETVDFLREHLGGGRIYSRFDHLPYSHGGWRGGTASFRYAIEGLPHETPLLFGIPTANCATPLRLARYDRVLSALTVNWLRHLGVKYVLSPTEVGLPVVLDTGRTLVSEVPAPATRFSLAAHLSFVADREEIFEQTARERDVNRRVYVEGEGEDLPATPPLRGRLRIERSKPSRHLLSISIDRSAFLLVHSVYHRGWRARLDGREVPVYRANYLFWGIIVPPGSHRIELFYRPPWFFPLLGVSAFSFLVTLFGFVRAALRPSGRDLSLDPDASRRGEGRLWWIVVLFLLLLGDAFLRHPDLWRLSTLRFPG